MLAIATDLSRLCGGHLPMTMCGWLELASVLKSATTQNERSTSLVSSNRK